MNMKLCGFLTLISGRVGGVWDFCEAKVIYCVCFANSAVLCARAHFNRIPLLYAPTNPTEFHFVKHLCRARGSQIKSRVQSKHHCAKRNSVKTCAVVLAGADV
jgi:hypothetical protein